MFQREVLQGLLDELVTLPHSVTVLSPFSFEIHPTSRGDGAQYQVVAERVAFELRVRVTTGYMAVALRSAVVAGAMSNPGRLERLRREIHATEWVSSIELTRDAFEIEARRPGIVKLDEADLMAESLQAAALLSEFVIDQLVITRPYGEMRPAVLREVAEESTSTDPWLYDPSERDRSSAVHRALENWLIGMLKSEGVDPLDPAGEPFFDLAWRAGGSMFICEVKSTINSEVKQLRLATGQLLHYLALIRRTEVEPVRGVILAADQPQDDLWLDLLADLGISMLWPSRWSELRQELTGHNGAV